MRSRQHAQHTFDVLIADPIRPDSAATAAALRRCRPSVSIVRVMYADQAVRIMFDQGLLTLEPARPRLIFLEAGALEGTKALLQSLCDDPRTRDIPVIVFSRTWASTDIRICRALGTRTYIVKPDDPDQYRSAVERIADMWLSPVPEPSASVSTTDEEVGAAWEIGTSHTDSDLDSPFPAKAGI
jgi:CheY-like chemotaxis protein